MIGAIMLYLLSFNKSTPIFAWYMAATLFPLIFSGYFLPKWFKLSFKKIAPKDKTQIWQLAQHSAVGIVSAGLIENIDILFVQRYLSPFETGLLAGVSKIAMMLLLIAYSLGNVLYPRVARYQDRHHLNVYLKKAF